MRDTVRPAISGMTPAEACLAAERALTARREQPPDAPAALAEALIAGCGAAPPECSAVRAARAIAAEVQRFGAAFPPGAEPAYHGRHHQAEATLVMGWLCGHARGQGVIDADAAILGVAGMAAHDLHHPGRPNAWPLEHEIRSADRAAAIAAAEGVPESWSARLRAIVLATAMPQPDEPDHVPLLHRLAHEADVFASALPTLGRALSRAIAAELRRAGDQRGAFPGTHAGRLAFLRAIPAPTAQAEAFGLGVAIGWQVGAYALCAATLDGGGSAERGAAALDRLPPDRAEALLDAALEHAGMPR